MTRVAIIGLGEVGRIFAEDLSGHELSTWDTAFDRAHSNASRNASDLGVARATTAAEAAGGADLVLSAVTAANCVDAAVAVAAGIRAGAWFFDLNSSSPGHKNEAARAIDDAGGRYVEAALMSPIGARRLESPFLLGGPHACDFAAVAATWGMSGVSVVSDTVGRAAATKLCRSVLTKGLEALFAESLLAARSYGVERDVLASLSDLLPPADWEAIAGYFVSRSLQHGRRRAEEMTEAAATVAEAGVEPLMSTATAARQAWAADFSSAAGVAPTFAMIDAVRAAMNDAPMNDASTNDREE
jgi:3-hydroxyisobutyrate dehydrogenase-like beta-hydroxyacid dehydrogenase